jgi:hypothetical protein
MRPSDGRIPPSRRRASQRAARSRQACPELRCTYVSRGRCLTRHWHSGVLVPAGVRVALEGVSHLQDGEHPAHGDAVVFSLRAHHRDGIRRHRHAHVPHVGHSGLAHRHVARHHLADPLVECPRVHPDQVGGAVPHLVHHVVGHVATHGPVARLVRHELDRARAADGDQHGRLRPLRRLGDLAPVGLGDAGPGARTATVTAPVTVGGQVARVLLVRALSWAPKDRRRGARVRPDAPPVVRRTSP